jgi:pyrroline-5-carboxylate reductase
LQLFDSLFFKFKGIELKQMKKVLKNHERIARVMPNVNCLCQSAASAFTLLKDSEQDSKIIEEIFSSVGSISKVSESSLDAVTGLSGSGPAYVFEFIEALSDAGVLNGLPREIATQLAIQTVFGSAKMLLDTKKHPGELKWMVTSPGGTTIEGLNQLEQGKFHGVVMNAVTEATKKSIQLRSKI